MHQHIPFEDRVEGDMGKDCLMSVDETDFRINAFFQQTFVLLQIREECALVQSWDLYQDRQNLLVERSFLVWG